VNSHPLCCDCDTCLNGSGGLVLPGAGVVVATGVPAVPGAEKVARERAYESAAKRRYRAKKRAVAA
jgi:hypothetical protein